jgi:cytidylate kinase
MSGIITISREYGAGGHSIAKRVAAQLGIEIYDRDIIRDTVKESGLDTSVIEHEEEEISRMNAFIRAITPASYVDRREAIHEIERKVILMLAKKGPCVILGRCGDYVLRNDPNHFSIFVCADDDYREKRGKEVYDGKSLKELNKENEKRARYYDYYTGRTWGDGANYDLVVNTSREPLDKIADAILAYIEKVKL